MMNLELTNDERIVVEHLVDDAIDGRDSTFPLPIGRFALGEVAGYAEPRRLDSGQRRLIQVALIDKDKLTPAQKQYLAQLLIQVAGLCLAKSRRLMGSSPELMLLHMKEFVR